VTNDIGWGMRLNKELMGYLSLKNWALSAPLIGGFLIWPAFSDEFKEAAPAAVQTGIDHEEGCELISTNTLSSATTLTQADCNMENLGASWRSTSCGSCAPKTAKGAKEMGASCPTKDPPAGKIGIVLPRSCPTEYLILPSLPHMMLIKIPAWSDASMCGQFLCVQPWGQFVQALASIDGPTVRNGR
jgi:hypothetical protein